MEYWRISDFADKIRDSLNSDKIHMNTVDGWFKNLESRRIHYVNRTLDTNEKVYDELDLRIAVYIKKRREEKWSLSAIFDDLENHFELRPFPLNEVGGLAQSLDVENLKAEIKQSLKETLEQMATAKIEELKGHYEEVIKQLPKPPSIEEQKEQRFKEMVLRRRVENSLEEEALKAWSAKPQEERTKKVGLFRKEEDYNRRSQFVKEYVNARFEEKLKHELNF
jgi:hypothetical protein